LQAEEARYGVSKRHKERLELLLPSKPLSVFGHGPPRCPTAAVAGTRNAGRKLKVKKKVAEGKAWPILQLETDCRTQEESEAMGAGKWRRAEPADVCYRSEEGGGERYDAAAR